MKKYIGQRAEGRGQRAEGRGLRAEGIRKVDMLVNQYKI